MGGWRHTRAGSERKVLDRRSVSLTYSLSLSLHHSLFHPLQFPLPLLHSPPLPTLYIYSPSPHRPLLI